MTGADLLVRELKARGVTFLPTLCGHGLDPILYAAKRAGVRVVDVHNEQTASYIADAYARLTRRVGVCASSTGIAHVNAFAGLLNAWFDGAPVLLITGSSDLRHLGRGAFQDVDHVRLSQPLCRHAELVTSAERIPHAVHAAFTAATSERPAPVNLTIPLDVLAAEVDENKVPNFPRVGEVRLSETAADADDVREAVRLLSGAQSPLIVAGTGAFYADAGAELLAFAEQAKIPVVTPIWDKGVVDKPSPMFLGVIGAASGDPRLLQDADALLLVGVQVDYRLRYLDSPPLRSDVRVVRVDVSPHELGQGRQPDVALLGNPKTVCHQLAEEWQRQNAQSHNAWLTEAQQRHQQFYAQWAQPIEGRMNGSHIVHALRSVVRSQARSAAECREERPSADAAWLTTNETVLLIDGGNIGQWAHFGLCADQYPSHWLTCGASAVVGWGIGGAMAARLAYPDRPVVLLIGDGAIGFNVMDIEAMARQNLPVVIILADDCGWGIVITGQQAHKGETVASELGQVDYAAMAQAMGARGVRVDDANRLPEAINDGLASGKVTLLHVPIAVGGPAELRL